MNSKNKIYWCTYCKVPLSIDENFNPKKCRLCGKELTYLCSDIRPVFPEERLLFELILNRPFEFIEKSVWCNNSTYFVDSQKYTISNDMWSNIVPNVMQKKLESLHHRNTYKYFDKHIKKFILANQEYFNQIRFEALNFVLEVAERYPDIPKYISFSGGKDSTVQSDIVRKSMGDASIPHIFCNTTLEYPFTLDYVKRVRKKSSSMVLKTVQNTEHDFYGVCDDIGVPSHGKRWCCTIFKTGVISKAIKRLFGSQKTIYFNGLRRSESKTRSNYERINTVSKGQKIQNQIGVSPILNWSDFDVWLYILSEKIDFNEAYKLGFNRAGCWCCPNTNKRNEVLSRIYMSQEASKWDNYLLDFAYKTGVDNPEKYIKEGLWKTKHGGAGLKSSKDLNIGKKECTSDENAKVYKLTKEINDEFYTMFIPFGKVCKSLGRKMLYETLVIRNGNPIISIQIRSNFEVKITTIKVKDHNLVHRKIYYQLLKFNLCRRCYKCESACPRKAISVQNDQYIIDEELCNHCLSCTETKYVSEGCLMKQYLRTGSEKNVIV